MGRENRLADLELVRHGTPRLENRTGTRAWTEPMIVPEDDRRPPSGLGAAQMLDDDQHSVGGHVPTFLNLCKLFSGNWTSCCELFPTTR